MSKIGRDWFYIKTGTGIIRGSRFRNGDKPPQTTFENLTDSILFFTETDDRAKVYDINTAVADQVGHVVLASNTQAKANQAQLTDRSLVVQPHQLPTVVNSTTEADDIPNDILPFIGDALVVAPDATTTRNSYIAQLSPAFKNWLEAIFNLVNTSISGDFIPITGTVALDPVTGPIQMGDGVYIYNDSSNGGGAPVAEFKSGGGSGIYGAIWNNMRTYLKGGGTITNPALHTGFAQSPSTMQFWANGNNDSNFARLQFNVDISNPVLSGVTVSTNNGGYGFGLLTNSYQGDLKTDHLTAPRKYQFPDQDAEIGISSNASSSTSIATPAVGSTIVFTTDRPGYSYRPYQRLFIYSESLTFTNMVVDVVSYSGSTLTVTLVMKSGTSSMAAINDWRIVLKEDNFAASASDSLTPGSGNRDFTIGYTANYIPGQRLKAYSFSNPNDFVEGPVTAYANGIVSITADVFSGSTPRTDWVLNLKEVYDSGWVNLTTINNWQTSTAQYRRIGNTVYLRGVIVADGDETNAQFSTMPTALKPTQVVRAAGYFDTASPTYQKLASIQVSDSDGAIRINNVGESGFVVGTSTGLIYLSGITYVLG